MSLHLGSPRSEIAESQQEVCRHLSLQENSLVSLLLDLPDQDVHWTSPGSTSTRKTGTGHTSTSTGSIGTGSTGSILGEGSS